MNIHDDPFKDYSLGIQILIGFGIAVCLTYAIAIIAGGWEGIKILHAAIQNGLGLKK